MIELILLVSVVLLVLSGTGNIMLSHKVGALEASPEVVEVIKEVEVVKRAMCECNHPSSMHEPYNAEKPNDGGCQQEFFELNGKKSTESFKCFCVRYIGPEPYFGYFDAREREIETLKPKALNAKQGG